MWLFFAVIFVFGSNLLLSIASSLQVAKDLVDIHRDIFVSNDISKYQKIREVSDAKKAASKSNTANGEMEIDDPNTIVPSVLDAGNAIPRSKPDPIIDEDGFELVVGKKKRK